MSATAPNNTEAAIWERVIHPSGRITISVARRLIAMKFSEDENARMRELLAKNRSGKISPQEHSELENFERVGNLLSILQSRARQVLKPRQRKS